ncbi:hypothetical protein PsYK624_037750 [Phanerochaete sordida]|uniref:Uncharacterized protein n=1 Tax=Phanerochaete sordida TaxID=48140 RepID=A0A9P3G417_9APHY|nr:hypothetical protein PsYK624_037750 [Phanerochaete sordida]
MAIILGRSRLHCVQALSPFCPLKLLLLSLVFPSSMIWGVVYETSACVPSLCLKYAVICIANALLATGWLLVSVLSVIGELIPKVSDVPPTLPRLPSSPSPEVLSAALHKRAQSGRSSTGVPTGSPSSRRTTSDHNVSHRVQFTVTDKSVATSSAMAPPTSRHSAEDYASTSPEVRSPDESEASDERPVTREASPSALQHEFGDAVSRGQKMSFLRRHLSPTHSLSKRPATRRAESHTEPCSSRAASPARSDHSATVKACLKKTRSQDSVTRAAPRTNPYQAPYFFPTPLSPDAVGYTSRIRAERVQSSDRPTRRTTSDSSESASSPPAVPESQVASTSKPPSPLADVEKPRPTRASRRSWHISFRSGASEDEERRTSWNSEVTTLVNSNPLPSDSSSHPSSPELKPRKSDRRRNNGRSRPPLTPLESVSGAEDLQPLSPPLSGARLVSRKTWHFPFRHRRIDSQDSAATEPLSDHAVNELPSPRTRPTMLKAV